MTDIIDQIKDDIQALDFAPLSEQDNAALQVRVLAAVQNNAIEGSIRSDEEVALDDLLSDLRAPDQIRMFASRRFLELKHNNGESLKGKIYPDCEF